jgi:hypothetical protein
VNDYYGLSALSYESLTLERLQFQAQTSVGAAVRASLRPRLDEDIWGGLVYRLTADVLAEKLPPESFERSSKYTWRFPSSPWQHFKQNHAESWWLGWLVRRRPVQLTNHVKTAILTVNLDRYRTFPQANYVFPNTLGPYVNVAMTRDSLEWE